MTDPLGIGIAIAVEAVQLAPTGEIVGAVGTVDDDSARGATWNGRRVVVGMLDACGECDVCRRGGAPVCPRATRREIALGDARLHAAGRWLVALDDGLVIPGPIAAAVPGDLALAYTLYARTGVAPRDPVVVCGGDAIARLLVEVLLAKGVTPVVVADASAAADASASASAEAWCAWVAARGAGLARVAADASAEDARAAVRDALAATAEDPTAIKTGGRPWRVIACGDVARAAELCGPRATLTVRATRSAEAATKAAMAAVAVVGALVREVAVLGVVAPHPDLVLEAAALVATGEIDLAASVVVRRADEAEVGTRDGTRADVVVAR